MKMWLLVCGLRYMYVVYWVAIHGMWLLGCGLRYVVYWMWFKVCDSWDVVSGIMARPATTSHRSLTINHIHDPGAQNLSLLAFGFLIQSCSTMNLLLNTSYIIKISYL